MCGFYTCALGLSLKYICVLFSSLSFFVLRLPHNSAGPGYLDALIWFLQPERCIGSCVIVILPHSDQVCPKGKASKIRGLSTGKLLVLNLDSSLKFFFKNDMSLDSSGSWSFQILFRGFSCYLKEEQ
jgi:hypothetical protein